MLNFSAVVALSLFILPAPATAFDYILVKDLYAECTSRKPSVLKVRCIGYVEGVTVAFISVIADQLSPDQKEILMKRVQQNLHSDDIVERFCANYRSGKYAAQNMGGSYAVVETVREMIKTTP